MRILFNAAASLPGTSGAVQTAGLLPQLAAAAPRHNYVLLSTREQTFLRKGLQGIAHYVADELHGGPLERTARLQLQLGRIARRAGADLVYNRGNFYAPMAGRQICLVENTNPFSTLRLGEPLWYRTRNRLLRVMSNRALAGAEAVIFPAEHTRRLIANRARVQSKSFVIPHGWELPAPEPAGLSGRPYLLCVSAILPYKNLSVVVDALRLLRDRGDFDGDLLIVGVSGVSGGGYYHDVIRRKIQDLGLETNVRTSPPVSPARLAALYLGARCLVMPSIEESFGIPVIEAMGLGTPVVASRVEGPDRDEYFIPFEEICGGAAEYFNPFDPGACADAIARALKDDRRRALISAGHERARLYSWRAAAERTAQAFDELS